MVKINKEELNFYKKIPKNWKGSVIFLAVKPQDFYKLAEEINTNNLIYIHRKMADVNRFAWHNRPTNSALVSIS